MTDAENHDAVGIGAETSDARSEKDGSKTPRARRTRTVRAKHAGNEAQPIAADAEKSDSQPADDVAAAPRERRVRQTRRTRPNGDQNA